MLVSAGVNLNLKLIEMMTFFLITTDHLETRLWFRDADDFRTGMNLVASVAFSLGVSVLSFILMSNHVHFVLESTEDGALRFITEFKRVYSRYLSHKYGAKETLRRNGIDVQELALGKESLERAIAYVQMNCVAANICDLPSNYAWGTGQAFFQVSPGKGTPVGNLSVRARYRLLHSKVDLPAGWLVGEDRFVLPGSYVNVRFVESLFRTPKRMNYFLQNSSKAKQAMSKMDSRQPSFRDQTILLALPDLCASMFQEPNVENLTEDQHSVLVDQLRRRFCADINQIGRVTGIPHEKLVRLFNNF